MQNRGVTLKKTVFREFGPKNTAPADDLFLYGVVNLFLYGASDI